MLNISNCRLNFNQHKWSRKSVNDLDNEISINLNLTFVGAYTILSSTTLWMYWNEKGKTQRKSHRISCLKGVQALQTQFQSVDGA